MSVAVGYIHPGTVSAHFAGALADTALDPLVVGRISERSGPNVSAARNRVVAAFLAGPADWLLMVDTDMSWEPDAVRLLMESADPESAPIVGALCFGVADGRLYSTIFTNLAVGDRHALVRFDRHPRERLVSCDATGAAFLLIHRGVLEAVRDRAFSVAFPWFQETERHGMPVSEDITFCLRARDLGYPVHVDTRVKTGHHKSVLYTEAAFDAQPATGV